MPALEVVSGFASVFGAGRGGGVDRAAADAARGLELACNTWVGDLEAHEVDLLPERYRNAVLALFSSIERGETHEATSLLDMTPMHLAGDYSDVDDEESLDSNDDYSDLYSDV